MSSDKKRTRLFRPILLICVFLGIHSLTFGNEENGVYQAAEAGLHPFLNSIPQGFESSFGFGGREEFSLASLGSPYQLCTIHPKNLAPEAVAGEGLILPLEEFRFPIICRGTMRALLTVARMNGEWRAVEIGAAGLAAELNKLEMNYPASGKESQRILLRLYQLKIDFAGFRETSQRLEETTFVPLRSARLALGTAEEMFILYSYPETLKRARDKYAELLAGTIKR